MATRVMINGAQGKMGVLTCKTLSEHPDFELVGRLTRHDNLRQMIRENCAEIVVDFTRADCVYENSLAIVESGAHPIIGTSGLTTEQIEILKAFCKQASLGGLIVPNFSIAAVLMMRFAADAAHFFDEVEIVEAHHPQKFDAPSGTAMKTAETIAAVKSQVVASANSQQHERIPGARGASYCGINIHAVRLPGIMARQQVIFGSQGETLTITHDSIDRISFMPGVVSACQRVKQLNSLYYGLEYVL